MVYPPGLCEGLAVVARRYPRLRLVVDHLALPLGPTGPAAFADLPHLLALARYPNVAVKASALPCHSERRFPFTDVHQPLRRVFNAFGPHRLFWGSDWTRLPCSYEENLALFTGELPFLSPADVSLVMGRALLNWLGWQTDLTDRSTTP
jgi:predicted TIM-barrel fold metal-dependent hydrolase